MSLGSKKYCYDYYDNKKNQIVFKFVVAGLKKNYYIGDKKCITMKSFEDMQNKNAIPHGRTVHWHCIEQPEVELYDYLGNKYVNNQKQGIAMLSTVYTFNVTKDYLSFVADLRNKYTNYFRGFNDEDFSS